MQHDLYFIPINVLIQRASSLLTTPNSVKRLGSSKQKAAADNQGCPNTLLRAMESPVASKAWQTFRGDMGICAVRIRSRMLNRKFTKWVIRKLVKHNFV